MSDREKSWRAATIRWALGFKVNWPDGRTGEEKIESDEKIEDFWKYKELKECPK